MFRSLHMKLTLILLLLITSLMAVVGAFLTTSVTSFYIDSFYQQMSSAFGADRREFVADLRSAAAQPDGAERIQEIMEVNAGMLGIADYFVKKGHLSTPCHYQFCLGVLGGMPATVENLIYLKDRIPAGSTWSAFGIGAAHLPILYAALALGGHIRVGMEDNVIFGKDESGKKIMATNQMLVQRAVEAVKLFGNQPATPAEAREILGIPPLVR